MTSQQIELIREKYELLKERSDNLQRCITALQDELVETRHDIIVIGLVLDGKLPVDEGDKE